MNTTTNAQNQNSQQGGRDLGEIMVKTYHRTDGGEYAGWWCEVLNKDRYRITFWEGNAQPSKADFIAWGYEWENGFRTLPIRPWLMASMLADLTSKSKDDRDYATKMVRQWTETGKAVHGLAMADIEECKARNEQRTDWKIPDDRSQPRSGVAPDTIDAACDTPAARHWRLKRLFDLPGRGPV